MATLNGKETASGKRYSQVYQATHEEGGAARLPLMKRSFISFTYGGKAIEDFNLIATISGDRMERDGYSSFTDTTTTYDNLDGQQYWSTHYKSNSINFVLATDGIDQKQLDEFLHWFQAGVCRELILAEHPNRAVLARVSTPPKLHLLPFEQNVELLIANIKYSTKTTLYKGEIDLSLVMDSPHWYSIQNILGKLEDGRFIDEWNSPNGSVNILESPDALKIVYEDNIPMGSMIQNNMLFGDGTYASVEAKAISCIWSPEEEDQYIVWDSNGNPTAGEGARIDDGSKQYGIISGAFITSEEAGIGQLNTGEYIYFYYAGTAPAPTIIKFMLTIQFDSNGYISVPRNSHTNPKYNTLTIQGKDSQKLCFTTPNILTSYNKAIEIFRAATNTWSNEDIRQHLRDEVRHKAVREWAINKALPAANHLTTMRQFFGNGEDLKATFEFNSETGEAYGTFNYKTISNPNNLVSKTEDVGDMLRSNYIIIRERNHPVASTGYITSWKSTNEETKTRSHRVYHDVSGGLSDVMIKYKNMYL